MTSPTKPTRTPHQTGTPGASSAARGTGTVRINVVGTPISQGSKRIGLNRKTGAPVLIDDNPKLHAWRHTMTLAAQAAQHGAPMLVGPLTVDATFRLVRPKSAQERAYPTVKPDVDKLLRAALDSLTGVTWVDDAQVVGVVARKLYASDANGPAGATITVKEVDG